MSGDPQPDQLDREILSSVAELINQILAHGETLAQRHSFPTFFLKALHTLDCPMAMKELGRRLHCDPSFVTVIADGLEKRGLARREAHPGDRRVKNIVLTDEGLRLRERIEREMTATMPWSRALDRQEREILLALIRKMTNAESDAAPVPAARPSGAVAADEEVDGDLSAAAVVPS
jgi:MarR family transcriptional regulator, organic hydroperoxide resistance regulator